MSFTLPDLVIEGAVRKGFDFLRLNSGTDATAPTEEINIINFPLNTAGNTVYSSLPILNGPAASATGFNATIRITNFDRIVSITSDKLVFTRSNGTTQITIDTSARMETARTNNPNSITGEISDFGATVVGTELLFSFLFIDEVPPQNTRLTSYVVNVNPPFNNSVTFLNIAGSTSTTEIIGAGGEVLNMLFNFERGGNNIDGGLDEVISRKYTLEPIRLREFFRNNQVAIVQSFSDVQANLPCISIQLANDGEDQGLAMTDDFGGIDGVFDSDVPARNRIGRDQNIIHANTTINIGIHTKEQLLTKYLYNITKYFILSAKEDLIRQNFIIATFRGSDFTRDASWQGDHVYTRFLNISGKTEDSWINLDEIVASLDNINLGIFTEAGLNPIRAIASTLVFGVASGATALPLSRSFYLGETGSGQVRTFNGRGEQIGGTSDVTWTANNELTNILTLSAGIANAHTVVVSNDLDVARTTEITLPNGSSFFMANGITFPGTLQSAPVNLLTSIPKQEVSDADDVLHRSNYIPPST